MKINVCSILSKPNVPDLPGGWGVFEAIKRLLTEANMILEYRVLKYLRLMLVNDFPQVPVKEIILHI